MDKREYPRVKVKLPLEIIRSGGEVLPARVLNISRAGMQVACDWATMIRIVPQTHRVAAAEDLELPVRAMLSFRSKSQATLHALCRVVCARRVSQDQYHVGLQYVSIEGDGETILEHYIAERIATLNDAMQRDDMSTPVDAGGSDS